MDICLHNGIAINVNDALELKKSSSKMSHSKPEFFCTNCNQPVRPHREGGHMPAHFEHLNRNEFCTLSHNHTQSSLELIESINEARANARRFATVKDSQSFAEKNFNKFFHWYYFSELGIFAPSKFIGYKNTSLSSYQGRGTGTATQRTLRQWFVKAEAGTPLYKDLSSKLQKFALHTGKSISQKTFEGTGGIYTFLDDHQASDHPEEINQPVFIEGTAKPTFVNAYERNLAARKKCIQHYGAKCVICQFEFPEKYGAELGEGFIHVHHLVDIAHIGKEYVIDPIKDLRPVCPNCHAMLHKEKPAMHPDKLRKIIELIELNRNSYQ